MQASPIDLRHPPRGAGITALTRFMEPYWREQVAVRGTDGLDLSSYPLHAPDAARADWRVPGQKPGTDLDALRRHALDGFGSRAAICNVLYGAPGLFNRHFASVVARATNDWLAAEWLDREPRLRGSIVVAPQDPDGAVAEIERRAADPRFVQVLLLAAGDAPLGSPAYWPIYAAAERQPPADRGPRRQHLPPPDHRQWLAVLSPRGCRGPVPRVPGPVAEPGPRGCVHQVQDAPLRHDRGRVHLVAELPLARPTRRGGASGPRCPGSTAPRPT